MGIEFFSPIKRAVFTANSQIEYIDGAAAKASATPSVCLPSTNLLERVVPQGSPSHIEQQAQFSAYHSQFTPFICLSSPVPPPEGEEQQEIHPFPHILEEHSSPAAYG